MIWGAIFTKVIIYMKIIIPPKVTVHLEYYQKHIMETFIDKAYKMHKKWILI